MQENKLGVDIHPEDAIFPKITWTELIETVQCNKGETATAADIYAALNELISMYRKDARYLLSRNMSEVLARTKL